MAERERHQVDREEEEIRVKEEAEEASVAEIGGSREQSKSSRGSTRGARTASARGQHREHERRAA